MTEFTPLSALIGGLIIGSSGLLLLLLNGKIAGISGIFAQVFNKFPITLSWQVFFMLGLILGPLLAMPFGFVLPQQIDLSWSAIIVGGFFVGFGSRYGSGCTSGHGICGIGRFSKRSIVATITFMGSAIITVYLIRHILGA
ncbi:YeeE/YedE thiosulfate transporter family protein [Thalassotalea psychrophila]|uniref:YeeE/YedE thiosulfate transporter family protein n=1 Tax=Thalassotalea psychrophila TaxID=3065647 RepID=A0ABY9TQC2_9GAMM|nr:YeeE/YedE thiosulfate transporter family protein [Colwelliaceae bacterium SQ149]